MSDYWLEVGGILFYTLFVNTLVIKKKGINKLLKMQERIIYFFFIRYLKLLSIILYNVTKCICKNNEKKRFTKFWFLKCTGIALSFLGYSFCMQCFSSRTASLPRRILITVLSPDPDVPINRTFSPSTKQIIIENNICFKFLDTPKFNLMHR